MFLQGANTKEKKVLAAHGWELPPDWGTVPMPTASMAHSSCTWMAPWAGNSVPGLGLGVGTPEASPNHTYAQVY